MTVRFTEGVPNRAVELVVDFVADGYALSGGGIVDVAFLDLRAVFIV